MEILKSDFSQDSTFSRRETLWDSEDRVERCISERVSVRWTRSAPPQSASLGWVSGTMPG